MPRKYPTKTPCIIDGCERLGRAHHLCSLHYDRWRIHGDPLVVKAMHRQGPIPRFWAKIDPCRTDGCYEWVAGRDKDGYGRLNVPGSPASLAHHFLVGKPPKGLEWDHQCRNRGCSCPEHLELVTHAENNRRRDLHRDMQYSIMHL